jgi:outer membrane protein OmpA-like peptidoglycan-associated protein/tetratricopeptide (TPR) repeat protein
MYKIVLILSFIFSLAVVFAQQNVLRRAEQKYALLSYSSAIPLFEEVVSSKMNSPLIEAKLAHSYYEIGNFSAAEKFFEQAFQKDPSLVSDYSLQYADALKQLGKYKESDRQLEAFHNQTKSTLIGNYYKANQNYLESIRNNTGYFTVSSVSFNSDQADFGAYYNPLNEGIYFVSSRASDPVKWTYSWNNSSFLDTYIIKKGQKEKAKRLHKKINTKFHEGPLCFSGNKVYFTRNNIDKGKMRRDVNSIQNLMLFVADVNTKRKWSNIRKLNINNKEYSIGHPTISVDGKTLYFVSDMPGGFGGPDIYKAEIKSNGDLGSPVNLGNKINSEGKEMFPWVSPSGQLFFSSTGFSGLGGLDIFVADLDKQGNVNAIQHCGPEINSSADDFGLSFLPDGTNGYFSSNRTGGKGDDDIYSFKQLKPFLFAVRLKGQVTDQNSSTPLANSIVSLFDSKGNLIQQVKTDLQGNYEFMVEPGKPYELKFESQNYTSKTISSSEVLNSGEKIIDAQLEKKPAFGILCLVSEAGNITPLEDASIIITDKISGKTLINSKTNAKGIVEKALEDVQIGSNLKLDITLSKEGYLSKNQSVELTIKNSGIINLNELMDVSLGKIDVGIDLATLIDIKPIFFDLGKYTIRKDAAIELEKIIKIMNEYPGMEIELGSHTDCRGSIASNNLLSANRAKASADYIKKRISNPGRINGKGYGESKLKIDCPCEGTVKSTCSEDEHQQNRRTEFIIMKM